MIDPVMSGTSSVNLNQSNSASATSSFVIPEEGAPPVSIWEETASLYDVRSITAEETAELSLGLYQAEAISFADHAILSFDPGPISLTSGSSYLTAAGADGRRDMIAEYEARIEFMQKIGAKSPALAQQNRILEYLKSLDGMRAS